MVIIPVLKLDTTPAEQMLKIDEEFMEVLATHTDDESQERKLEECYDLIEATVNYMYKIANHEQIQEAGGKLLLKLTGRGHSIIGLLKVILE